eukprot:Amastigsp_a4885_27.p3 type:complete len:128 gc:universal Amastigsp_a4885_27:1324-941(-)
MTPKTTPMSLTTNEIPRNTSDRTAVSTTNTALSPGLASSLLSLAPSSSSRAFCPFLAPGADEEQQQLRSCRQTYWKPTRASRLNSGIVKTMPIANPSCTATISAYGATCAFASCVITFACVAARNAK